MSAREVVEEMRFVVSEENRERDPDCYFVFIEPVNKLEVKKEVAASEDAEEEVDVCVGIRFPTVDPIACAPLAPPPVLRSHVCDLG